ncbi:MAG: ABC transporter permease [Actinomycetaceae bacterium]|nr:ABC transporter permease [Actinomycetaceae bacterium]
MRTRTLALRVLAQLRHDRRTLALVIVAPLLILTLLYLVLTGSGAHFTLAVGNASEEFVQAVEDNEAMAITVTDLEGNAWEPPPANTHYSAADLRQAVTDSGALAAVTLAEDLSSMNVYVDGTSAGDATKIQAILANALHEETQARLQDNLNAMGLPADAISAPEIVSEYVYGKEDATIFDAYGAALIGIIVFFVVFLIAGINFLTERTSGALERMLSTPIKRSEIIAGYTLGYSVLALIQTVLVTLFVIYVIGMDVAGSIWHILLINLLTAICALTLGIMVSNLASSEFQMVQFIPIVVVPQIFLSGVFPLDEVWDTIGHAVPLYYTADALQKIVIRGDEITAFWLSIVVLTGFSIVFILGNVALLRRQRTW